MSGAGPRTLQFPPPLIYSVSPSDTLGSVITITGTSLGHHTNCIDSIQIGQDNTAPVYTTSNAAANISVLTKNTQITMVAPAGNGLIRPFIKVTVQGLSNAPLTATGNPLTFSTYDSSDKAIVCETFSYFQPATYSYPSYFACPQTATDRHFGYNPPVVNGTNTVPTLGGTLTITG